MQLKQATPVILALAMIPSLANSQCPTGTKWVDVSGRVTTLNVSPTRQVGQICLTMTNPVNGREAFDDCGALVGTVTSTDATTGTRMLSHTAVFELTESFRTANDVATIMSEPTGFDGGDPCAFPVVTEHITQLKWGTGIFYKGSMDVTATGSVSFCPGHNLNMFSLTGHACLLDRFVK